jgi:enoyl-CoA hydratase/carnithine racemase
MTDTILCHTEDQILIIRINRPEVMNALDPATHLAMSDALDAFEEDDHLRVAIITGAGKKAFCAGGDISVMSEAKTDADYAVPESGYGGMTRRRCRKPVIAAVNGFAFGGGFEIVLACHLAIAAEDAVFSLPEPLIGTAAVAGGLHRLPRYLASKTAYELLLTAKQISAFEALTLGLVNEVVAQENVLSKAIEMAERICRCAPLAIEATLEVVQEGLSYSDEFTAMDAQYHDVFPSIRRMMLSQDTHEGLKAFIEKRRPNWSGK